MGNLIISSRSMGINYMRLNKMVNVIYNFMTLGNILTLIFVFQKNLFSYAMTYNKLIKFAFVNKDETFIFFSLPDPARIFVYSWLSCGLDIMLIIV